MPKSKGSITVICLLKINYLISLYPTLILVSLSSPQYSMGIERIINLFDFEQGTTRWRSRKLQLSLA